MTLEKCFLNYTEAKATSARISDGSSLNIQGQGNVDIVRSNNGQTKLAKIKNIVYFPNHGYSLLAVSNLVHNGFRATF